MTKMKLFVIVSMVAGLCLVACDEDTSREQVLCSPGDHPIPEDYDCDRVENAIDNCPFVANGIVPGQGQPDRDDDRVGDVCDNCQTVRNPDQSDSDDDGIGDACEASPDAGADADADADASVCVQATCDYDCLRAGFAGGTCATGACECIGGAADADADADADAASCVPATCDYDCLAAGRGRGLCRADECLCERSAPGGADADADADVSDVPTGPTVTLRIETSAASEPHVFHGGTTNAEGDYGPSPFDLVLAKTDACRWGAEIGVRVAASINSTMPWYGCDAGAPSLSTVTVQVYGAAVTPAYVHHDYACRGGGEGNLFISRTQLGCP